MPADWASSKDAMMLYGKNFAITARARHRAAAAQRARTMRRGSSRWTRLGRREPRAHPRRVDKRYNAKSEK